MVIYTYKEQWKSIIVEYSKIDIESLFKGGIQIKLIKNKQKKIVTTFLLICLIYTFVSSIVFISEHTNHNCIGDGCYICLELKQANETIKKLIDATFEILVAYLYLFVLSGLFFEVKYSFDFSKTLVKLKVRLDN